MKKLLKILGSIIAVVVVLAVVFVGIHMFNAKRYAYSGPDPRDKSSYDRTSGVHSIEEGDVNGFHFSPTKREHPGTVVVFGGSEGSPDYERARALSDAGYEVLSLFFFGQPGQQQELADVPLELFDRVSEYAHKNVDKPSPITVIGSSKGAEFAANLAATGREIDHLVLYTPSEYTYQGLSFGSPVESSFTDGGAPVPFVSFRDADPKETMRMFFDTALGLPVNYRPIYVSAATRSPSSEEARIKIEKYGGDGLLFAGEQDAMWQGEESARSMAKTNPRMEAHVYPDAGHLFSEDISKTTKGWKKTFGGTVEGNREAKADSDRVLLQKLASWHGQLH